MLNFVCALFPNNFLKVSWKVVCNLVLITGKSDKVLRLFG